MQKLLGKTVLIVEDNFLIADDLKEALATQGAAVVGPVYKTEKALELLAQASPDCAILDVYIGAGTTATIATALNDMGVPYVVVSGYQHDWIPKLMQAAPYIAKPFAHEELINAVSKALQTQK
jgi:DNA-binding NarL/FixJ family response regulator